MRAAVINRLDGTFDVEELTMDRPLRDEVLVEVGAAGLCHSDFLVASVDRGRPVPMVAGHEMAGTVIEVGDDVRGLEVGDRVVATEVDFCGACRECRISAPFRCLDPGAARRPSGAPAKLSRDGEPVTAFGVAGFAERVLLHRNKLVKVPTAIPFAQAAVLGCAVSTGVGAVLNSAGVRAGQTVAVVGLGGVGLNVVQGAVLAGARAVVGIDVQPSKLELGRRFGATHVVNASTGDVAGAVRDATGGGADHVFEAIGFAKTQRQAIGLTRTGGSVNFIGIPQGSPLDVDVMRHLLMGQRTFRGVYMGSTDPRRDIPFYAELYLQGRLNLDDLVSARVGLDAINEAYARQETGAIARSVITF